MTKRVPTLGAVLALAATTIVGITPVASAQTVDCAPAVIMPIRGSSETTAGQTTYDDVEYEGWEGPTLRRYLKTFYSYPESAGIPILELGSEYPAVPVHNFTEVTSPTVGDSPVFKSANKGVRAGVKEIDSMTVRYRQAGCPIPKVILVGYSQGMIVARSLATTLKDTGLIAGVYGVGDPLQKPSADSGVMGSGSNGEGIYRFNYGGAAAAWDKFYDGEWENYTICHDNDLICRASAFTLDGHFDYFTSGRKFQAAHNFPAGENSEDDALSNLMIGLIDELRTTNVDPPVSLAKKDTVFLIDTTGSMSPVIGEARTRARELSSLIVSSNGESRVSLIEYRDVGDAFVTHTVVPFTNDLSEFHRGLDGLFASGGGDWEEAVYSGVQDALGMPYRPDAVRSLIVIGDAPAHDPDKANGWTTAITAERLRGFGEVDTVSPLRAVADARSATRDQAPSTRTALEPSSGPQMRASFMPLDSGPPVRPPVTLYSLSTDRTLHDQMSTLANATGGVAFGLDGSSEVGDAIEGTLVEIDRQPVAQGGADPVAIQSIPVTLSCAGSSAPDGIEAIGFDLDGDGAAELPCLDGTAETTFHASGNHEVSVIVVDSEGRTGMTRFDVDVLPAEAAELTGTPDGEAGGSLGNLVGSIGSLSSEARLGAGSLEVLPGS